MAVTSTQAFHVAAVQDPPRRFCLGPTTVLRTTIFALALEIDPDALRVRRWYRQERLAELGGWTAQELCVFGFGDLVIDFLRQVGRGCRG